MSNPYQTPPNVEDEVGIFCDHARLTGSSFLFRKIQFQHPFVGELLYSGWWFWQRIYVCEQRVWSRISWTTIDRHICFQMPGEIELNQGRLEIQFVQGLRISRFRVWIDENLVFDEIH